MSERGYAIQEAVSAMNHEHYLKQLARQRDNRMAQKRKKKEADATAIATTSDGFTDKKPLDNYTKETEECQPSQSTKSTALPKGEPDCGVDAEGEVTVGAFYEYDTAGDNSGGEVRQQGIDGELPVHLL